MAHAIEMYFDGPADTRVRRLWQTLADSDLPSLATMTHRQHRPHVTLTVVESLDNTDLTSLRTVLRSYQPTLHLYVLGTFPSGQGALFLGVPVTTKLLAYHADAHAALAGRAVEHWPPYQPGNWVPHCTLAEGLTGTQASTAFRLLCGYEPITTTVMSIGIKDTTSGAINVLVP
jgi:2'-5' RNA ligase